MIMERFWKVIKKIPMKKIYFSKFVLREKIPEILKKKRQSELETD